MEQKKKKGDQGKMRNNFSLCTEDYRWALPSFILHVLALSASLTLFSPCFGLHSFSSKSHQLSCCNSWSLFLCVKTRPFHKILYIYCSPFNIISSWISSAHLSTEKIYLAYSANIDWKWVQFGFLCCWFCISIARHTIVIHILKISQGNYLHFGKYWMFYWSKLNIDNVCAMWKMN